MILVAGVCDLRFAEIAGLRVGRLDLLRRQLHVLETVYGHLFTETNDAVMGRLDEVFAPAESASGS